MLYLEQIRKLHGVWKSKKAQAERAQFWFLFGVLRPFSFWITPPFLMIGITANQVTVLGWVTAVAAAVFYGIGGSFCLLLAAAAFFASYLLDLVDGNIARFRDSRTHYGNFLDAVGDAIRLPLCTIGLAIGIQRHLADYSFAQQWVAAMGDGVLTAAAAIAAILYLLHLYLVHRLDRHRRWIIMQEIEKGKTLQTAWAGFPQPFLLRGVEKLYGGLRRIVLEVQIVVWCALSIMDMPDWLLAWAVASAFVESLGGAIISVMKARYMIQYPRP